MLIASILNQFLLLRRQEEDWISVIVIVVFDDDVVPIWSTLWCTVRFLAQSMIASFANEGLFPILEPTSSRVINIFTQEIIVCVILYNAPCVAMQTANGWLECWQILFLAAFRLRTP